MTSEELDSAIEATPNLLNSDVSLTAWPPMTLPRSARAAATATHSLWISDDLLADAFHRFTLVARATRRHGSSCPGPLEARRRLAQRRMGIAAAVNQNHPLPLPLPADVGSLFSWATKWSFRPVEKSVRYEAPTPLPLMSTAAVAAVVPAETSRESLENDTVELEGGWGATFSEASKDPVGDSRAAFEALLYEQGLAKTSGMGSINTLLEYLQGSQDEPEAHNTLRLLEWLTTNQRTESELAQLQEVIIDKISLQSITEAEVQKIFLHLIPLGEKCSSAITDIATALVCSWPTACQSVLMDVTASLVSMSDREAARSLLDTWLVSISNSPRTELGTHFSDLRIAIYAAVAPRFRPSELPKHFGTMRTDVLVKVLLGQWVVHGYIDPPVSKIQPLLMSEGGLSVGDVDLTPLDHPGCKVISPYVYGGANLAPPQYSSLYDAFTYVRFHHSRHPDRPKWRRHRLLDLVTAVARHRLPYGSLLTEVFKLYQQRHDARLAQLMFLDLHHRPDLAVPPRLALDLIDIASKEGRLQDAFRIFKLVPSVPLVKCLDLPFQMVKAGKVGFSNLALMLKRRTKPDRDVKRDMKYSGDFAASEILDAVSLLAYNLACSPYINARVALRRVSQCYFFLRGRHALHKDAPHTRTNLMARAFVKAGIVRAFAERRFMSKDMTRYVLSRVAQLESEDVAEALDKLIFDEHKQFLQSTEGDIKRYLPRELREPDAVDPEKVRHQRNVLSKSLTPIMLTTQQWQTQQWQKEYEKLRVADALRSTGESSEEVGDKEPDFIIRSAPPWQPNETASSEKYQSFHAEKKGALEWKEEKNMPSGNVVVVGNVGYRRLKKRTLPPKKQPDIIVRRYVWRPISS